MAPAGKNYFKQFRSGYLSEGNMSNQMREEIDWFLNQLNDDLKAKLITFWPKLIQKYEQEVIRANELRHHGQYLNCQKTLRNCNEALLTIKRATQVIDWYIDAERTYLQIEKNILIDPSMDLQTIKLFRFYLEKAKSEIKQGALEKSKLYLTVCSSDLQNALKKNTLNLNQRSKLIAQGNNLLENCEQTKTYASYVANSLSELVVKDVINYVNLLIEEQRYQIARQLLTDLSFQLGPRIAFLRELHRIYRILPEQEGNIERNLTLLLKKGGWTKATDYLLQKMTNAIHKEIKKIPLR